MSEGVERETLLGIDWFSDGSAVGLYRIDAPSQEAIESVLMDLSDVISYDVTEKDDDSYAAFVHFDTQDPLASLLSLADRHSLMIDRPLTFTDDGVACRIVGEESSLQEAIAEIPEGVDLHIESTSGYAPGEQSLRTELTARQRETVETALELGYYESPREVTYEEIADALDCAPSTANELLRRAEGKLIRAVFDA